MAFAHKNGVIHRDVKPGNVLIDGNGMVKVTDFGIARARNTTENLTQTGAVMGTATYFSPEQAQGLTVDERSDVYSLGVVLYEMVASKPPFIGDNPVTIAYKHVREVPPPLREINSSIPQEYVTVVSKALAKSPASRYANADELRADLQRFEHGQPVRARITPDATQMIPAAYANATRAVPPVVPAPRPVARPQPSNDRSIWGPLLLLVSLIAAVVIGLIFLFNSGSNSAKAAVTIPNVVGKTQDQATQQLKQLKLQVTVQEQADSSTAGNVLAQNPTGNSQGHEDDVVQITVSTGPEPVKVDDYTGQSADAAKAALQKLGLKVQITEQSSESIANDTVISQSPEADTEVQNGGTVTLTVSTGPEKITVPNVVGFTISTAAQTLSSAGLRTSYPNNADSSDIVASTDPAAGTEVSRGTTIVLTPQVTTTTSSSSTSSTTSTTSKKSTTTTTDD